MDSGGNFVRVPKRPARFRLLHGKKSKLNENRQFSDIKIDDQRPQFRPSAPPPPFYANQNLPNNINNGVQKTIQLSFEDQKRLAELTNRLTLILQGRTVKDCTLREKENIEKLEQQRRVILESAMVRQQAPPQCVMFNGQPVQFHDQNFAVGSAFVNGAFKQQPCTPLSFGNLPPASKQPILSGHIVQINGVPYLAVPSANVPPAPQTNGRHHAAVPAPFPCYGTAPPVVPQRVPNAFQPSQVLPNCSNLPSTSFSTSNFVGSWRNANYNLQQNQSRISCQNISKKLENDRLGLDHQNFDRLKRPFGNFEDIRDRLLPYHLYDEPDLDEKFLELFDKLNDARAKILNERSEKWLEKFRCKVFRESSKLHADGETILLQKLWLKSERENFNDLKVKLKEEGNSVNVDHVDQNLQEKTSLCDRDRDRKIQQCIEIVYNRVVSKIDLNFDNLPTVVISLPKIDLQVQKIDTESTKMDEICINLPKIGPIAEILHCKENKSSPKMFDHSPAILKNQFSNFTIKNGENFVDENLNFKAQDSDSDDKYSNFDDKNSNFGDKNSNYEDKNLNFDVQNSNFDDKNSNFDAQNLNFDVQISNDDEPRIVAEELSPPTTTVTGVETSSSPPPPKLILKISNVQYDNSSLTTLTKKRRRKKRRSAGVFSSKLFSGDIQEKLDEFVNIPISNGISSTTGKDFSSLDDCRQILPNSFINIDLIDVERTKNSGLIEIASTSDSKTPANRHNFHPNDPSSKKVPPLKIRLNKRPDVPQPMTKRSIGLESSDSTSSDLDSDVSYDGKMAVAKKSEFFQKNSQKILRGSFVNAKTLSPPQNRDDEDEDEFL